MGDIADAMIEGSLCSHCGEYLDGEPAGIPVLCNACYEEETEKERAGLQKYGDVIPKIKETP